MCKGCVHDTFINCAAAAISMNFIMKTNEVWKTCLQALKS